METKLKPNKFSALLVMKMLIWSEELRFIIHDLQELAA
jgi:hypothetical protein